MEKQARSKCKKEQTTGELIQMEWAKTTIAINNPRVKIPEYPTQNNKQFRW